MNIGHLEGLPHPYSLGDLYTITMVINPPTNWELILQALMSPFAWIVRNIDWQNSDAENWQIRGWRQKKMAFSVAFFWCCLQEFPAKKKWGNNSTRKTPKQVFFV